MIKKNVIETERLFLREIREEDSSILMELFSDQIAMQFFPNIKDENEVKNWINRNLERYQKDGFGLYICRNKNNEENLGYCGLTLQENVDGVDEVEIGYGLIRKYWYKGFATEAAIGCKKYGFDELKLERLISLVRAENVPSINVALRNGMTWTKDIMRWNYLHGVYSVSNK